MKLRLPRLGKEALELAPVGLVASEDDFYPLLSDAVKLERMLSDFAVVSPTPLAARELQLPIFDP